MRGILPRIAAPLLIAAALFLVGILASHPFIGLLTGTAVGYALAWRFARQARERLRFFLSFGRSDSGRAPTEYPLSQHRDEIDDAFTWVTSRFQSLQAEYNSHLGVLSRQNQLLDRMNDGIMRVDAHGTVSYANVAAGALFRGRNPTGSSFIAVTRDHELSDLVHQNLETGEDQQHTFEIAGEAGVYNAVITRIADAPPESLVVLRDISEVTRLQTLRRDFVANVSHDLRTPLSSIKIMTETLLDLREDDEDSQHFLAKIDDEIDVMTALVNDLLDLASLEGGESRLTIKVVDLDRLIEDVRDRMGQIASRHEVQLRVNLEQELGTIEADERRLHQALVNLVSNAIVHTPPGGNVEISARSDGDQVTFQVSDTGVGIHPTDLPRVWERFFRADRSRSGRGTGLGLAIVKHIVLAHGGTMNATSEPGRGSVFTMMIPASQRRDPLVLDGDPTRRQPLQTRAHE